MKEGVFLPVRSVVDNPCPQWLWKATGAYQFQEQKQAVAAYSGHNIDRVILVGKEDVRPPLRYLPPHHSRRIKRS